MANTPFLDLVKPAGTDRALVSVINSNSDKIDTGVSTLSEQIANALTAYTITTVSSLDNLKSGLSTVAATLAQNEKKFITFNPSFTAECFKNGIRCYGELHKRTDAIYSFTGVDLDGRTVSFANVNGTWKFEQLATKDTSIENLGTKTFGSAKEMINFFKQLAGDSAYRSRTLNAYCYMSSSEPLIFGTSSFMILATFTSSNYGNILCMSDNRTSGGVKNICVASNTAYIQIFTASETSLSLT